VHGQSIEAAIGRLAAEIERKVGVRLLDPMVLKLRRILATAPVNDWFRWVEQLTRAHPDSPDWLALVESILNHETSFYRRSQQWEVIAELLDHLLARQLTRRTSSGPPQEGPKTSASASVLARDWFPQMLRIWSAGCASGEEAYTLAMMGLEAFERNNPRLRSAPGVDRLKATPKEIPLRVIGSDISRIMIRLAESGEYRFGIMGADRELPDRFRKHFVPINPQGEIFERSGLHRISENIRAFCQFQRQNLLVDPPPASVFDLVMCQNVLIYCSERRRTEILMHLTAALHPGGYLILGPTDPAPPSGFKTFTKEGIVVHQRTNEPESLAFYRSTEVTLP
jgi:chemotaxis protein methyltransferase CheR